MAEQDDRPETGRLTLRILRRGLADPPVWNENRRAKNWAATISPAPLSPGGLRRDWWERGRGDFRYVVPADLAPGDAVEFGADYVSLTPRRHPERWYGVVLSVAEREIVLLPCARATEALERAAEMRALSRAAS